MPRNVELIQKQFGSREPLPSIELADNALKLNGIEGNLYALKSDLSGEVEILLSNIDDVLEELREHEGDDVRHLTPAQIEKINNAINATQALQIANNAINSAKAGIEAEAVQSAVATSNQYTNQAIENKMGELNLPTHVDPVTGETVTDDLSEALETSPQNLINPEYFYRFKNMIDNSSFEVFDGNTLIPYGWDNGTVSKNASMFGTYSLNLNAGQTAKQTNSHQPNMQYLEGAYDTDDAILAFYHKLDAVQVKIYDVINERYLTLTRLDETLAEQESGSVIEFPYVANWNQYRCMVKFTPASNTQKVRIEFTCKTGGTAGSCNIDAPSLEPYEDGKFPSIYKDGKYSVSAYQIQNPPPTDVDRFTPLEHLTLASATYDDRGNALTQVWERTDGTTAIERWVDENSLDLNSGYYQTIYEKFYLKDGVTENYTDTYHFTYTTTGAILTQYKTTNEVIL